MPKRLAIPCRLRHGLLVTVLLVGIGCLPRDDLSTYSRSSGEPPEPPPVPPPADAGQDARVSEPDAGGPALPADAGEAAGGRDAGQTDAGQVDGGALAAPADGGS